MRQETVEELNFETIKTAHGPADELFQKTIKESFKVECAFEKNRSRLRRRRLAVKITCHPTWRQSKRPSRLNLLRLREEGAMSTEQEAYTLMIAGTEQN